MVVRAGYQYAVYVNDFSVYCVRSMRKGAVRHSLSLRKTKKLEYLIYDCTDNLTDPGVEGLLRLTITRRSQCIICRRGWSAEG